MPYRLLCTNVPLDVGEEEFYDYVRAHVGGGAVVNALLIMRPSLSSPQSSSSGAALVDYASRTAAEAARRADFYVGGVLVMVRALGSVPAPQRQMDALAAEGREAYRRLRCGIPQKRQRDDAEGHGGKGQERGEGTQHDAAKGGGLEEREEEMELRLVGIPSDVYGSPFAEGAASHTAVDLFTDVARSVRRATLGELLSLRRISDDEAVIRVCAGTAEEMLERAEKGIKLVIHRTTDKSKHSENDGQLREYTLSIHRPRPHVQVTGENFLFATKHEVMGAMARMMELTNAKVAGFIDPFGNFLLPSAN